MSKTLHRSLTMLSVLAVATLTAGCATNAASEPDGTSAAEAAIEIPAFGSINGYPQIPVAVSEGYIDQEFHTDGATIEVAPLVSANDGISALRTGNVDMVVTGYDPAGLVGVDDIVMLSLVEASPATTRILVAEDSDIETLEDLEGRVVASYTSTPNAILVEALRTAGLTADDIEYIMVESDVAASTLASGSIDAWLTFDPAAANAELAGIGRMLATGEDFNHLNPIVLYTTRAYLDANRESVLATMRAFDLATEWITENQSDGPVAEIMAEATGLDPEVAQRSLDHREYTMAPIDDETLAWMTGLAERADALGLTGGLPDLASLVDNSVYEEALGE